MAAEYTTETRTEEHSKLTAKICDKCGGRYAPNDDSPFALNLVHNFGVFFGYGSEFDNAVWSFDLCEPCLLDFVATFRQAPTGFAGEDFEEWAQARRTNTEIGGE
ncbi:hypothetical protein [Salibacterium lacus]|uniref:Uncharacterized protein n=1 Tax=Salibacterium lacus TaxID=1898109 RepID=A0ABW5SYC1_9BACI